MRKDFHRVLTEDPRVGGGKFSEYRNCHNNRVFDEDAVGGKESMMKRRRIARGERKNFGDHLNPLRKWIRKQVGRKWNDVYSEVCDLFDQRSQTKYHVHLHIFANFVEINTRMVDGEVCIFTRHSGWKSVKSNLYIEFYVHPVTGVLHRNTKDHLPGHRHRAAKEQLERKNSVFRVHDSRTHLFFVDGQWWVYTLAKIPELRVTYLCPPSWSIRDRMKWDVLPQEERELLGTKAFVRDDYDPIPEPAVLEDRWGFTLLREYPADMYYASKQVASKKILKKHGLLGQGVSKEKTMSHREAAKYR